MSQKLKSKKLPHICGIFFVYRHCEIHHRFDPGKVLENSLVLMHQNLWEPCYTGKMTSLYWDGPLVFILKWGPGQCFLAPVPWVIPVYGSVYYWLCHCWCYDGAVKATAWLILMVGPDASDSLHGYHPGLFIYVMLTVTQQSCHMSSDIHDIDA